MKDRLFEIWFSLRCGQACKEFQPILEQFGSAYDVFNAEEADIQALTCSDNLKAALLDKSLREAYRISEYCKQSGTEILFWQDEGYPASLRSLSDPPVLLYYRGSLPALNRRLCISVVGTRKMSEYGKRMAYKIGYELAAAGTVVVSGMALGNDSVATAGALAAGGHTVAVLGSGLDIIYPKEHTTLYGEITRTGVVMSEYPPGTPPESHHFPQRNRIISGLSQGTVVVEGDLRSGALITAKTAILQGREIYAFPGNVGDMNTAGTNQLIRDGAAVILSARDVLDNYLYLYRDVLDTVRLGRAEKLSEPDPKHLSRLGVCTRTLSPRKTAEGKGSTEAPHTPAPARSEESPKPQSEPKPFAPPVQAPPPPAAPAVGDASERILKSLSDTQRGVFEALPLDHAVPVDYLTREGFSMSDIMASMTILEIKGLVVSLPGGLYARK